MISAAALLILSGCENTLNQAIIVENSQAVSPVFSIARLDALGLETSLENGGVTDLGTLTVGDERIIDLQIANTGPSTLTVAADGIAIAPASATEADTLAARNFSGLSLAQNKSAGVELCFLAQSAAEKAATITIASNDYDHPVFTHTFKATGTTQATTAAPVFSLAGGTYTSDQTLSISCATAGASIYYTLDGSAPTTESTVYNSAISLSGNGNSYTIRAFSLASGALPSTESAIQCKIAYATTAIPVFSLAGGTYTADQTLTITCATAKASIYYTLDGTAPSSASTVYSGPISLSGSGSSYSVRAIALAAGYLQSAESSIQCVIDYSSTDMPVFSLAGGTYTSDQSLTITCSTTGASIYYTLNDTTPTASSTAYTGPISLAGNGNSFTVRAVAIASGRSLSSEAVFECYIDYPAPAAPTGLQVELPSGSTGYTRLDLSWDSVDRAVSYQIFRDTSNAGSFTTSFTSTETSYQDTTVMPGTKYYYKVRAVDERSKQSAASSIADKTTAGTAVTGISLSRGTHAVGTSTVAMNSTVSPDAADIKTLAWTSSNSAVATVSATGVVTRVASGTVTIKAAATDNSGVYATCYMDLRDTTLVFAGNFEKLDGDYWQFYDIPTEITGYFPGDTWTWTEPAVGNLPHMADSYGNYYNLFKCWNDQAAGSGTNYYIGGTTLTLAAGTTTLYAQWVSSVATENAAKYLLKNYNYASSGGTQNQTIDYWSYVQADAALNYQWPYPSSAVYDSSSSTYYRWCGLSSISGYSILSQDVDLVSDLGLDPAVLDRTDFSVDYVIFCQSPSAYGNSYGALNLCLYDADGTLLDDPDTAEVAIPAYDGEWHELSKHVSFTNTAGMAIRTLRVINQGKNGAWIGPNYITVTLK